MNKRSHRLLERNIEMRTGVCVTCGPTALERNGKDRWRCIEKRRENQRKYRNLYRKYLKDTCERCGFIPEVLCQLDVHHIDENHSNNSLENLQTLCANCHRLIHWTP